MVDKHSINELLNRAAFGYDEGRLDMLDACFTKDADFSMTVAGNEVGPFEGKEAIMKLFEDSLAGQTDQRRHVISNHFYEAESDGAATVISYLTLISVENQELTVISSGYYRDDVVDDGGAWRIKHRFLALDRPY